MTQKVIPIWNCINSRQLIVILGSTDIKLQIEIVFSAWDYW